MKRKAKRLDKRRKSIRRSRRKSIRRSRRKSIRRSRRRYKRSLQSGGVNAKDQKKLEEFKFREGERHCIQGIKKLIHVIEEENIKKLKEASLSWEEVLADEQHKLQQEYKLESKSKSKLPRTKSRLRENSLGAR